VGSYVYQSNYWNRANCPGVPGFDGGTGTQCIEVNTETGAFSVTQGAPPCGTAVSAFPNILYGCSYGNCSPQTILPLPVNGVWKLTSSWDFDVGGQSDDRWNVSYDLWFCPDANCGALGFPGGLELMIWLDYRNAYGWKDHVDTVKIGGYTWDVWKGDILAGGVGQSWGYMNYIVKGPRVKSVTDLDLNAFIKDAVAKGYLQKEWYLFGVQVGMEVRTGGMPFNINSYSLAVNNATPTTAPLPYVGPICDGAAPATEGQLAVSDTYVTAGSLHGYGSAFTWVGQESKAVACSMPICSAGQTGAPGTCAPDLGPSALCTAGTITADPTYASVAGIGFDLNQDLAPAGDPDGGAVDSDGGVVVQLGTITIPNGITVSVTKMGSSSGNNAMRAQLVDDNGNTYCYGGSMADPIPIGRFNTKCWDNSGDSATSATPFRRFDIVIPSSAAVRQDFAFCITNLTVQ
jgi:cellulose 1,4-beta-cellobiosidase